MFDSVSNLQCWLKTPITGLNDTDPVVTWEDTHTSNIDFAQASAGLRGVYKTNIADFAGYSIVEADGVDNEMNATGLDFTGKTGFTVIAILKTNATLPGANSSIIGRDASGDRGWAVGVTQAGVPFFIVSSGASTRTRRDGSKYDVRGLPCVLVFRFKGSSSRSMDIFVNGILDNGAIDAAVPATVVNDGPAPKIFNNSFGDYWGGQLVELAVYDRDLTNTELNVLTNHALLKYNLGDSFRDVWSYPDTGCHQGYTTDGVKHYTIDTAKIQRRLDDEIWQLDIENTSPFTGVANVNHLGDGHYYNGKLYVALERWVSCSDFSDQYIAVYDATTLALDAAHDVSAQGHEISSVVVVPEHNAIYAASFCDGTQIWKYHLSTFVFVSAITLSQTVSNIQGITWDRDRGVFYVADVNGYIYRVGLNGITKMVYGSNISDTNCDHEGLNYYNGSLRWLIDENVSGGNSKHVHELQPLQRLEQFKNGIGQTTLSADVAITDYLITVADASVFPSIPNFRLRLGDEIMVVRHILGNTFSVERGAEETTISNYSIGNTVNLVLSAGSIDAFRQDNLDHNFRFSLQNHDAQEGQTVVLNNSPYIARHNGNEWEYYGPVWKLTPPIVSDFTWVNQGSSTADNNKGPLVLTKAAGTALNLVALVKTAPTPPFSFNVLMAVAQSNSIEWGAGVCVRNSSDGKLRTWGFHNYGGVNGVRGDWMKWNSPTSQNSSYYFLIAQTLPLIRLPSKLIWWRWRDDGTNIHIEWSHDGYIYRRYDGNGRTDFVTPNQIGFYVSVNDASNNVPVTFWDWKIQL